jgi:hypothetical protein
MNKLIDYISRMIDADPISIVISFFGILWIVAMLLILLH